MRAYFIRRLLLIPPTLLGISIIVFGITRLAPGGPLERAIMEAQMASAGGELGSGGGSGIGGGSMAISEEQIQALKEYYGLDKPIWQAYLIWLGNIIRGDFGDSFRYSEPVWDLIRDRFPISLFYGITTLVITYAVCLPLGIVKAIKHRTHIDNWTSIIVFAGYAIPGYALGAILLLFFAARLEWFPMGGFTSYDFEDLSWAGKILDLFHHGTLPLICYLVGSFAVTTLLMKNNLMENLAADYVRTAVAKGVSFKQAVLKHALRNSLIPVATTFGQNITLLVSGSFLIETIFDIDGFGLLGFRAVLEVDFNVVMGTVMLSSFLLLFGNILSDVLVALIDPRIRFE
jgi:microcin C transport system permease protein